MGMGWGAVLRPAVWVVVALGAGAAGCHGPSHAPGLAEPALPRELDKVTMPDHVIEAPDVLLIDAVKLVPKPPYRIETLDTITIQVRGLSAREGDYAGEVQVGSDGTINFGEFFGRVRVVGLTIEEAREVIERHLKLKDPDAKNLRVEAFEGQSGARQQIRGEHLVRPDGRVSLGSYGEVRVAGLTLAEAKAAIEAHLAEHLAGPKITVDVATYNSKVYYVIFDGGGNGQRIHRQAVTGNETVLDAISQVNGLIPVSSQHHMWVARPAPPGAACGPDGEPADQILPVDWVAITTRGRTATNYQLLPGDRLFVKADPLVTLDTRLARLFSPIQRVFYITLIGNTTVRALMLDLSSLFPSNFMLDIGRVGGP